MLVSESDDVKPGLATRVYGIPEGINAMLQGMVVGHTDRRKARLTQRYGPVGRSAKYQALYRVRHIAVQAEDPLEVAQCDIGVLQRRRQSLQGLLTLLRGQ